MKQLKRIFPLAISIALLAGLALTGKIGPDLLLSFNPRLFIIFVIVFLGVAMAGSLRLYANLTPFYSGVSFRVVHGITAYSMLSGLFFAGIVGATLTKISLPALSQVNKNLVILISIVEKIVTIGVVFLIGVFALIKLRQVEIGALVRIETPVDFYTPLVCMGVISLFFLRSYITAYSRLVMAFLPKTIFFSFIIVLLNLIPPYMVFTHILDVSVSERIILSAALVIIGSLPISFQGIGAREVAATLLLSQYDVSSTVIIGHMLMLSLSSILSVVLLPATTAFFAPVSHSLTERMSTRLVEALNHIDINQRLLAIPCVILCFFRTEIAVMNNTVSITPADFFSLFFVFVLIGNLLENRMEKTLKRFFIFFSILFLYFAGSFGYGFFQFGFSKWAFYNRLVGSIVLLGFVYAGYLLGTLTSREVQRKSFFLCWMIGGYLVIFFLVQGFLGFGYPTYGVLGEGNLFEKFSYFRFSGPGANPETFAFSAGIMVSLLFFYGHKGFLGEKLLFPVLFVFSLALGMTRSMVGLFCFLLILVPSFITISKPGARKKLAAVLLVALVLSQCFGLIFQGNKQAPAGIKIEAALQDHSPHAMEKKPFQEFDSPDSVVAEEMRRLAWTLFKENWVFGSGLGGLHSKAGEKFDRPVTLENSFLLYLTDTGIVGILLMSSMAYWLYTLAAPQARGRNGLRIYFLGVSGFVVAFSIFFDISFQRFLWIWVGFFVAMADPLKTVEKTIQA